MPDERDFTWKLPTISERRQRQPRPDCYVPCDQVNFQGENLRSFFLIFKKLQKIVKTVKIIQKIKVMSSVKRAAGYEEVESEQAAQLANEMFSQHQQNRRDSEASTNSKDEQIEMGALNSGKRIDYQVRLEKCLFIPIHTLVHIQPSSPNLLYIFLI